MASHRIFFGDLTHDTIGLATEVFPLNIGFIAAYCKQQFGDDVDVRLFKYITDLETAIEHDPPDILALSNYPWCANINMAMFRQLSERRPEALRAMGGPHFPHGERDQRDFMAAKPLMPMGTTAASAPPAKMACASPILMVRHASPSAWVLVAQALQVATLGPRRPL